LRYFRTSVFLAVLAPSLGYSAEESSQAIEWEVANRFGPFATQIDPEDMFSRYKLAVGESFENWHKRLSVEGLPSPYLAALKAGRHGSMHWDQRAKQHQDKILSYVRDESDPGNTVTAVARVASQSECTWFFQGRVVTQPCAINFEFQVPLAGSKVQVTFDGNEIEELIKPEHVVIVGMGDSYASGEGNPDYPGEWMPGQTLPGNNELEWLVDYKQRLVSPAEAPHGEINHWVDDTCHRSFYSHQSLTALKLASENPHAYVSFLHYACTGAEAFDGLLVPQYQAWGKGVYVPFSQVNFAIRELCQDGKPLGEAAPTYEAVSKEETGGINIHAFHRRGGPDNQPRSHSNLIPSPQLDNFSRFTQKIREENGGHFPQSGLLACPKGKIRTPDYVFLNEGGNSMGFADIIKYFVVPTQWKLSIVGNLLFPEVCPSPAYRVASKDNRQLARYCRRLDKENNYHSGDLTNGQAGSLGMKERYTLLFNILEHRLGLEPKQIVMAQYPDPLRDIASSRPACEPLASSDFRVPGDPAKVFNPQGAWNGLKAATSKGLIRAMSDLPGRDLRRWQFNLTASEAGLALKQFDKLREVLSSTARDRGISLVCETRDAFVGYGWWKGTRGNLPNTKPYWAVWDWNPYAYESKTRAIRTGNDTVITQPGDKRITGAVHPNLTGHRLIAQMVYDQIWEHQ
jgi:hypothetical protein